MPSSEDNKFGRACVFLSRSCGALSAIIILLSGFITLIPLPSTWAGNVSRCIPTGLLIIVCAVVTFFLEATVLGYFFERLSFLIAMSKYINNWMRFVLYLIFAVIPVLIWCISASTVVCLGLFFTVAAINFMLAIGTKGDHADYYARVTWSKMNQQERGEVDKEEEEIEEEEDELNGDVLTGDIDKTKLTA